jgi:hypothetical protein
LIVVDAIKAMRVRRFEGAVNVDGTGIFLELFVVEPNTSRRLRRLMGMDVIEGMRKRVYEGERRCDGDFSRAVHDGGEYAPTGISVSTGCRDGPQSACATTPVEGQRIVRKAAGLQKQEPFATKTGESRQGRLRRHAECVRHDGTRGRIQNGSEDGGVLVMILVRQVAPLFRMS